MRVVLLLFCKEAGFWVVVSNIFYFHPYYSGRWTQFDGCILFKGVEAYHQLMIFLVLKTRCFCLWKTLCFQTRFGMSRTNLGNKMRVLLLKRWISLSNNQIFVLGKKLSEIQVSSLPGHTENDPAGSTCAWNLVRRWPWRRIQAQIPTNWRMHQRIEGEKCTENHEKCPVFWMFWHLMIWLWCCF